MSQEVILKIKGRYTNPSELSEVPEGALSIAKNVDIDRESIATPRRGFDVLSYSFASPTDRASKLFEYQDKIIAHYATNKLAYSSGSAWIDYPGTYSQVSSGAPLRSAKANENFYLTSSDGIYKLDAYNSTPVIAGVPKGVSVYGATSGTSGFLEDTETVAYRVVWGYEDANKNLILGAPSERAIVTNTTGGGASRNVDLTILIPQGITTSHFYQVYRSSAVTTGEASDEMYLVYEDNPTSGEVTAGSISITDITPTDLTGATLYTSPSQESIAGANEVPPLAKDIATYKGHLFFANTKTRHRLTLTMLASLTIGDVITIGGVSYTAAAATNVANDEFKTFTGGSASQDIADTSRELIKVINQSTTNTTIYSYYLSGAEDLPGKILLEARDVATAQFSVTFTPVGSTNPWSPRLPTSGTTVSSSNDEFKNGLYFSKPGQPEAVPLSNIFRIGSADDEIRRILALRDSLFILKDDGVWRLTGEDAASFRIEEFDSTAKIIGPETATILNNAIYFLSSQGVVQCTETGVSVISRPIEQDIIELFSSGLSVVGMYSFGLSYESERKYFLGTVTGSSDTSAKIFHVYNTFTSAWTTYEDLDVKHGFVRSSDDKIYLADAQSNDVRVERKSLNASDHADYLVTATITDVSSDGRTLTISNTDLITKGDVVYQSSSVFSIVESVDQTAGTATLYFNANIVAGTATVYTSVKSEIEWVPVYGKNPANLKHFQEASFLFRKQPRLESGMIFSSDVSVYGETVTLDGPSVGNWGYFSWGSLPWGGAIGRGLKRAHVPLEKARATQLDVSFTHSIAFSDFEIYGLRVLFNTIGARHSR